MAGLSLGLVSGLGARDRVKVVWGRGRGRGRKGEGEGEGEGGGGNRQG